MGTKSEPLVKKEEMPYENKSIIKKCRVLTKECHDAQNRMDKGLKYTLGEKLSSTTIELATQVYIALDEDINSLNKEIEIRKIRPLIYKCLVNVRLANDMGQIDARVHSTIIQNILSIRDSYNGWIKYIKKE